MNAPKGLRERKKHRQRLDLIETAARLFRQNGYDATRMDDIAAAGEVSTKTVYNYFPTKQALLAALLQEDRAQLLAAYEIVISDPPEHLPEALAALMRADIGQVLTPEDKKLWRELIAAEVRTDQTGDTQFATNRALFLKYIEELLTVFNKKNILSRDVPIRGAAELCYSIYYLNFSLYCGNDKMNIEDFMKKLSMQTELLVQPWLNRATQQT
ncbi:MAG: TetR/AcrR family transcriptional regulator [Flavobacteriaceae bacterium]